MKKSYYQINKRYIIRQIQKIKDSYKKIFSFEDRYFEEAKGEKRNERS